MLPKTTEGTRHQFQVDISYDSTHMEEEIRAPSRAHRTGHLGTLLPPRPQPQIQKQGWVLLDTGSCGTDGAGRRLAEMSALILERLWDEHTGPENRVATWPTTKDR